APPSLLLVPASSALRAFHPSPTRRSSDLGCVACTEHAQCPETACRVTTGACFPASNRVWVDASADCDAGNGSETNPYCEVTDAFDLVQSQPGNDPWTIRLAGSDTPYEGQTSWSQAKPLALIGPASGISAQLSATSGTAIGTSQEVYVSNIVVDATGSTGVYVGGGGRAYLH